MLRGSPERPAAPRLRRGKADAIDAALMLLPAAGAMALARRARGGEGSRGVRAPATWVGPARRAALLLGERYGSPGERIAGVRTVDPRSGEPVPLSHTAALSALSAAGDVLTSRLGRAGQVTREQRNAAWTKMHAQLTALEAEHRDDPERLNAERARLYAQHRAAVPSPAANLARPLLAGLLLGVLQKRLRRRYAPSTVVVWDWSSR